MEQLRKIYQAPCFLQTEVDTLSVMNGMGSSGSSIGIHEEMGDGVQLAAEQFWTIPPEEESHNEMSDPW